LHKPITLLIALLVTAVLSCGIGSAFAGTDGSALTGKPNIIFILIDDMRWDAMSCVGHPFLRTPNIDRIAKNGILFTNAFVTISLCSPARATFMTGAYAHNHGVRINEQSDPDPAYPIFPKLLQSAGYETAYVGKWHMKLSGEPRDGFDYWLSFRGQGRYNGPKLNENGRQFRAKGYMTDLLTRYAVDFLKRPRTKPFCLCLAHKAAHWPFTPAGRHKNLFKDLQLPKPANFQDDLADKPEWMRAGVVRGHSKTDRAKNKYKPVPSALEPGRFNPRNKDTLNWYRSLVAVDESVGAVLDTLDKLGIADNTVVIFAGDNGFLLGEHRQLDKRVAFEESIRIPLLISGPFIAKPGSTNDRMVLDIDVAPTVLEIAGVNKPKTVQGRSLKPLLAGLEPDWRKSFLYEYFLEDWYPGIPDILAVRTSKWKYVTCPATDDINELYDLKNDPLEMKNLIDHPAAAQQRAKLRAELTRLMKVTGYSRQR